MSEILKYYTDVDKADVTITNKNGELLKTITSSELIAGHTIAELPQGEVYTYNFKLSAKTDFAAGEAVTNKVVVTPENKPPIEASVTLTTTAPITSTIAKPPETGDNNYLLLCEGVMLVSIVGIAYVIISVLKGKRNVRNT